jgi:hypothetical protein
MAHEHVKKVTQPDGPFQIRPRKPMKKPKSLSPDVKSVFENIMQTMFL